MAGFHLYYLDKLLAWLDNPRPSAPEAWAVGGMFFCAVSAKRQQTMAQKIPQQARWTFHQCRRSHADGVVVLDEHDRIEWLEPDGG